MSTIAGSTYSRSSDGSLYSSSSSSSRNSSRQGGGGQTAYYPGSYAGSHVGMTNAGIADPVRRIGFVEGMPPHEWFTSGASRDHEQRRYWSPRVLSTTSTAIRASSSGGHVAQQPRVYNGLGGESGDYSYGQQYLDDAASIAPSDSVSNAPSARSGESRRSRSSRKSSHGTRRRDSVIEGSQLGQRYLPGPGSAYMRGDEAFGEDEQAYDDEINRCVTRKVVPGFRR